MSCYLGFEGLQTWVVLFKLSTFTVLGKTPLVYSEDSELLAVRAVAIAVIATGVVAIGAAAIFITRRQ